MSKKILFCAALVLAIFAGAAQKRQVMLDRVVAVVGGSSILWSEVDEYAGELVEQRRQQGYTSDRDPNCNPAGGVTLRTAIPPTKRSNNC